MHHLVPKRPAKVTRGAGGRMYKLLIGLGVVSLALRLASASSANPISESEDFTSAVSTSIDPAFFKYATEVNTDKTWDHSYQYIYSRYLANVRREPMRLLEIGLGCNMGYGAGHSLALWKKYLPNTKVSFVEYDAECARKHKTDIEASAGGTLYIGDQEDKVLLNEILADSKAFGGYDVIIDDGGHTVSQMLTSVSVLWHALKPGGVYIVEDLSENYIEKPFGDSNTFMAFAKNAIDIVQCRMKPYYMEADSPVQAEFKRFCADTAMDVISVECAPEICALVKGAPRVRALPAGMSTSSSSSRDSSGLGSGLGLSSSKRHHLRHTS